MSHRSRRRTAVASAVAVVCVLAGAVIQVAGTRGTGAAAPRPAPVAVSAAQPAVGGRDCAPVTTTPPPPPASLPGHVESLALGGHTVIVDVPGAYAVLPATRFPVVYFLHGSPGAAADWLGSGSTLPTILDNLYANGQLMPMIAVFPDDRGVTGDDSWWGDTALGDSVESWLTGQLVPAVDTRYRTMGARHRGIAGVSAGGFGAVNISIRHPGMFDWTASYSGVFTAPADLFGAAAASNSPEITAAALPATARAPLYLGAGAGDTEFLADTEQFAATVQSLGWSPLRTEVVPGPHGWEAWQVEAQDSLEWLGQLWGANLLQIPAVPAAVVPRDGCAS